VTFTLNASKAIDNPITVDPSAPPYDCIDLYGVTCTANGPTSPIPKWRHTLRTTWSRKNLEVSLNWRYIGSLKFEATDPRVPVAPNEVVYPADSHVAAYNYFDLNVGHESSNVDVRVGVNNLFDKKPPIVGLSSSPAIVNGNLLAGIFDPFGREIFVEATAHF
jgi:outer membrane receptor protein involved in Fe transport